MSPQRLTAAFYGATLLWAASLAAGDEPTPGPTRHPAAVRAENEFFHALNVDPSKREAAHGALMKAFAVSPGDARVNLLLGLSHLWVVAEAKGAHDPTLIDRSILAIHYFENATRLNPADTRIPSWRIPAAIGLAAAQQTPARIGELMGELRAEYEKRPAFHGVALAMMLYRSPPGSPELRQGLELLNRAKEFCAKDPTLTNCRPSPRWKHRTEGFDLFYADYAMKAGDQALAESVLREIPKIPEYSSFPFKGEVKKRLHDLRGFAARLASDKLPMVLGDSGIGCQVCHLAR
jgi:hypothetical protein